MASIIDTNYAIPNRAYFISPNGNDTDPGTENAPWLTIGQAIKSAPQASTVVIREGTYREGDLGLSKNLTLQPYPHEAVWLKGSIKVVDWVADGTIWCKNNWNYKFPHEKGSEQIDQDYPVGVNRDMVFINDQSCLQVANKLDVGPKKFFVDYNNAKLYIGDNPLGKTVEATTFEYAFSLGQGSDNSVARGLGFTHYAEEGLTVRSSYATLENNVFTWNGVYGLGVRNTTDAIVRRNKFTYNGQAGLNGVSTNRMLVEDNLISHNNIEHFAKNWAAAGAKFVRTDSLILRNNVVEQNQSHGLWIDVSSKNTTVVRNTVSHNQVNGIFFEISHKAVIASNLVVNNGLNGVSVFDSSSAKIYNNTFSKNVVNINFGEGSRVNDDPAEIAAGITYNTANNVVKNNILSNTEGLAEDGLSFHLDVLNQENSDNNRLVTALNYNAYYRTNSITPKHVIRWSPSTTTPSPVRHLTVADFEQVNGFEANALAFDNIATNPFFLDEANGNYRLKTTSPAIKQGEPLPAEIASAIGLAAGVPVNIGALFVVSIAAPANANTLAEGSDVPIMASVFDLGGSITRVEFFRGSTKLGEDTTAPYSFIWQNVPAGSHTLTAKATDNQGVVATSSPVSIGVTKAPVVFIENPADGAVITADTGLSIRASANDLDGSIARVEFFQDGTKLGEDTTAPYSFTWQNVPAGSHTLTAKATDNQGVVTTSSPVSIEVTKAPVVSIGYPADGAVITGGTNLNIRASARDPDGSIAKVEFFRGSTKLGEDTTAPYSFTWQNVPGGNYTLIAKATDNQGVVTTSSPVSIEVNKPPTVSISAPSDGARITPGTNLNISANANDPDGSIAKVEFFRGSTKLGEDTTAPYSFTWQNIPAGSYTFKAKATDNQGAVITSSLVSITVR